MEAPCLRKSGDNIEQRAIRAQTLVQVGELSYARQEEGADLARKPNHVGWRSDPWTCEPPRTNAELTNFVPEFSSWMKL